MTARQAAALLPFALLASMLTICAFSVCPEAEESEPTLLAALPKGAQLHMAHRPAARLTHRITLAEAHRVQ